jgi:RNA ligase (TIGR02306 family)
MTELLLESNLDETQARYAKIVQESGSNLITIINDEEDIYGVAIHVSSKGMGGRNLAIERDEKNVYWRAVEKYNILKKVIGYDVTSAYRVAIFGEVYGQGIQDLHYGVTDGTGPAFAAFDIWIQRTPQDEGRFIDAEIALDILTQIGIPIVPILYSGPYDYEGLAAMASGMTTYGEGHVREGVVVRPFEEARSEETGSRKIAKFVSDEYLTRKGDATEYE